MGTMDATAWDERYRTEATLWGSGPNAVVERVIADLSPGDAVDLACGNGRHALWLAQRGWHVTGVDFSAEAIAAARSRPGATDVRWVVADVTDWSAAAPVDLVLVAYLQLPVPVLGELLHRARGWLRPGGRLVYLGHARENLEHGVGGPSDARLLPSVADLAAALSGSRVDALHHLARPTDAGTAIDVLAVVRPWVD